MSSVVILFTVILFIVKWVVFFVGFIDKYSGGTLRYWVDFWFIFIF